MCAFSTARMPRLDTDHRQARFGESAEQPGEQNQAIGISRGGRSTKIHAIVDSKGRPLNFTVTGGQVHDNQVVGDVLDTPKPPLAVTARVCPLLDNSRHRAALRPDTSGSDRPTSTIGQHFISQQRSGPSRDPACWRCDSARCATVRVASSAIRPHSAALIRNSEPAIGGFCSIDHGESEQNRSSY